MEAALRNAPGDVHPSVWQHVSTRAEDPSLAAPPTWEEFLRVIRDMHLGKAGGEDTMVGSSKKQRTPHTRTYTFRFYDLEKADPRVVRPALWRVLTLKGCPANFIRVLQASTTTHTAVRFQGFESSPFLPGRGLREGCPSSPILFNLYHDAAVMDTFRPRRASAAAATGHTPGIRWTYKVDGKIGKRKSDRETERRHLAHTVIGDLAYADDAAIVGEAAEVHQAEGLMLQTFPAPLHLASVHGRVGMRAPGWGVAVFNIQDPHPELPWMAALYGPVCTAPYDPVYVGAARGTNNTAEITAIVEACFWLLDLHARLPPGHPRLACIHYDSEYAYGVVTHLVRPNENHALVQFASNLVTRVRLMYDLQFTHVKGHAGHYGNEVADPLAARGSRGRISPHAPPGMTHPRPF